MEVLEAVTKGCGCALTTAFMLDFPVHLLHCTSSVHLSFSILIFYFKDISFLYSADKKSKLLHMRQHAYAPGLLHSIISILNFRGSNLYRVWSIL